MIEFWITLAAGFVVASAGIPLSRALAAVHATNLAPTMVWLTLSLLAWLAVLLCALRPWPVWPVLLIALAVTACAGISVLGARSPGLGAWNFVTVGLLAVLLLPLIEQSWNAPHWSLDLPRAIFTGLVIAVGAVNYVPTRWGLLALISGGALGVAVWLLAAPEQREQSSPLVVPALAVILALCVWGAWLALRTRKPCRSGVDRLWLDFRDGFGLMWAKRVQEQFNQAALNAAYGERLAWHGVTVNELAGEREAQLLELLRAVLRKFGVQAAAST